ncbi:MAG: 4'-phosphopantetheinyl transferase [Cellvibrionaceae bacterium]|jgi:4'-phosphopantetheinyl transferase
MKLPNWTKVNRPPALPENTIDLWLIDLNPADFHFPNLSYSLYSADELERAARFRFDRHRRQYLVGRGRLRSILAAYTGTTPAEIQFNYGDHGKPALASPASNVQFNLSNSHEFALVGVSYLEKIGVDLEYRDRHIWDADGLAQSVFTEQEKAELAKYPADQRLIPFLSGWTRKEAYLKGIGKGLALPLTGFSVELENRQEAPSISADEWELASFWCTEDYLSAVAFPASPMRPHLRYFIWDGAIEF